MKKQRRVAVDDDDKATELIDLDVDRVDAVETPATGRGFIIRKTADVKHPNNANGKHLDRSREPESDNPLLGIDPVSSKAWKLLLSEIRKIVQEELRAARGPAN